MNKFWKYVIIISSINLLVLFCGFVDWAFFYFWGFLLIAQLIGGVVLPFFNDTKLLGKALLLSLGITVLIGFSICSNMRFI